MLNASRGAYLKEYTLFLRRALWRHSKGWINKKTTLPSKYYKVSHYALWSRYQLIGSSVGVYSFSSGGNRNKSLCVNLCYVIIYTYWIYDYSNKYSKACKSWLYSRRCIVKIAKCDVPPAYTCFRRCDWLSVWCLWPWIKHLPPVWWSTSSQIYCKWSILGWCSGEEYISIIYVCILSLLIFSNIYAAYICFTAMDKME